ncbi:MAG TPA: hypothetical protein VG097_00350 [Gemmata sp.]|nr:hypothetical protein [Gemmata sp.]
MKKGPGPEGRGYKLNDQSLKALSSKRKCDPTQSSEDTNRKTGIDGNGANNGERPVLSIDPQLTEVSVTMREITGVLVAAGKCYRRAGQLVRITDTNIIPVLLQSELAGLLNHYVEFVVVNGKRREYKPLPSSYASIWLNHPEEITRLPEIKLFTQNPVYTDDWRLVSPGYDTDSGIYYSGPAVKPRASTKRIDLLLRDFCFRSPADRTNYIGMLITSILVPRFIGSKPAVIFSGNQPGLGKSILAQVIAIVRDGHTVETVTYNPNDEEFEKRLGATVRRGTTTVIIDNAKGKGRNKRIESACLERSITDAVLSFRLVGSSSEIRAENSHVFCLTANTPDVSRDLVSRSVLVALFHEGDPTRRQFVIDDPEGYAAEHRLNLLSELVGMVEEWKTAGSPRAIARSRFNKKGWGPIIGGILAVNGYTDFLANSENAAVELDDTRRDFAYLLGILAGHPQGTWTATELAQHALQNGLLPSEFKDLSPKGQATWMGILAGRYVKERFTIADGRVVVFCKADRRKGNVYHIDISEASTNEIYTN